MNEETENTITTEAGEKALPCFVRHEDAGGPCWEPEAVRLYGLAFCERHGEEARLGAALEAGLDAENYFQRLSNPHIPDLPPVTRRGLEAAISVARDHQPGGEDYYRAILAAYAPSALPEEVRARVREWQLDEEPGYFAVVDSLLDSLSLVHKLMRVAYEDRADFSTGLIERLEQERESVAAQAAVALELDAEKQQQLA